MTRRVGAPHVAAALLLVVALGLFVAALTSAPRPGRPDARPGRPAPVPDVARPPGTALRSVSPPVVGARVSCTGGSGCVVAWEEAALPVRVHAGASPDRIDRTEAVAEVVIGSEVVVPDPTPGTRRYFEVVAAGEERGPVVGDRYLGLGGAPATRDLGGYTTVDGRRVRWGTLFRSGGLDRLTDADRSALTALGLPGTCPAPRRAGRDAPTAPGAVADRAARARDAKWLRRLAGGSGAAWAHCDAADDRRGWPTALLLATLGVPRETIVADHLLTNRPPPGGTAPDRPVSRASVDTAFEAVIARYGTFARYLERGLRLDPATVAALRDRFLTAP